MKDHECKPGRHGRSAWLAVGLGIAAGWAFLIGLYLGLGR